VSKEEVKISDLEVKLTHLNKTIELNC